MGAILETRKSEESNMRFVITLVAGAALAATLAGCGAPTASERTMPPSGDASDGLSGTQAQFDRMTNPCIAQASRMTGLSRGAIVVTNRIRTGGGPLLTLDAGGKKYSCRLKDDGNVTVFSEFAN
jgi:hypothetical protein